MNIKHQLMTNKFVKYVFVGGVATVVDWGSFFLTNTVFGLFYQVALVVAFTLGSITNYTLNRTLTFQSKSKKIAKQFTTHLTISVVSLVVNMGLMYVIVSIIGLSPMGGRVITTLVMLIANYFLHKNITFNNKYFGEEDYV